MASRAHRKRSRRPRKSSTSKRRYERALLPCQKDALVMARRGYLVRCDDGWWVGRREVGYTVVPQKDEDVAKTQTVVALERRGFLEREGVDDRDWWDARRITEKGRERALRLVADQE